MLILRVLDLELDIWRLPPDSPCPSPPPGGFFALTRTAKEISVVSESRYVSPAAQHVESGWSLFMVQGPLAFEMTGVLAALAAPLANAGISIFAISTHDTDYILVKSDRLQAAIGVLQQAGHTIHDDRERSG